MVGSLRAVKKINKIGILAQNKIIPLNERITCYVYFDPYYCSSWLSFILTNVG